MPNFWYAMIYSNWSGVSMYEDSLYQMVNVFFAFVPIVLYAVLDQDTSYEFLEQNPKLYFPGPGRLYFNTIVFWTWFVTGAVQSIMIVMICSIPASTAQPDGKMIGFWATGMLIFTCVIILVN